MNEIPWVIFHARTVKPVVFSDMKVEVADRSGKLQRQAGRGGHFRKRCVSGRGRP